MLLLMAGCGGNDTTETELPPGSCKVGERIVEGGCLPAGVQPSGCAAGELTLEDGSCQPAGVPPSACAPGFEPDGDLGCSPLLPADPCPKGQLAVPGDTSCRPVMVCGNGAWGDIPVEADTIYVDGSYAGGDGDGSSAKPFVTVQAGIDAASPGAIVAIAAGSYAEELVVQGKALRLWGACASQVALGGGSGLAALLIREGADGSEVHDLGLVGMGSVGLLVSGATDVLLDRLWMYDALRPLSIESSLGETSVTLSNSLIEDVSDQCAFVGGGRLTIDKSLIRGQAPESSGPFPAGVNVSFYELLGDRSYVVARQSLFERMLGAGIFGEGSDVTVEGTVVRDIQPTPGVPNSGYGFGMGATPGQRGNLFIRGSLLEHIPDAGVASESSTVEISDTVIRVVDGQNSISSVGIFAEEGTEGRGTLTLRTSLIERAHGAGVTANGADLLLEGVAIRDIFPRADLSWGMGIAIDDNRSSLQRSALTMIGSRISRSHAVGVYLDGSDAIFSGVAIDDVQLHQVDQKLGRGMQLQSDVQTKNPAAALVDSCLIVNTTEFGIAAATATLDLRGTAIVNTAAGPVNQVFGDGVAVLTVADNNPATMVMSDTAISGSARAGVSVFGSQAALRSSLLDCNAIDIDGEPSEGIPYGIDNQGGNDCGCGTERVECKVVNASLSAPAPF